MGDVADGEELNPEPVSVAEVSNEATENGAEEEDKQKKKKRKILVIILVIILIIIIIIVIILIVIFAGDDDSSKKGQDNFLGSNDNSNDTGVAHTGLSNSSSSELSRLNGYHCWKKRGRDPRSYSNCSVPSDPMGLPPHPLEKWFKKETFNDWFQGANLGWGPSTCSPYSYESFVIAARYFPTFCREYPRLDFKRNKIPHKYNMEGVNKRELAAFFAVAFEHSAELNRDVYKDLEKQKADYCFFRGGLYSWFNQGIGIRDGTEPDDGKYCRREDLQCNLSNMAHRCYKIPLDMDPGYFKKCFFGRGPIRIQGNVPYGNFQIFLNKKKIKVDIFNNPNKLLTSKNPPLAFMAAIWFWMYPRPPMFALHDIITGKWLPGVDRWRGSVFGPINTAMDNDHCVQGEEEPNTATDRLHAFRWYLKELKVPDKDPYTQNCWRAKNYTLKAKHIAFRLDNDVTVWTIPWPCKCRRFWKQEYPAISLPYYMPEYWPDMEEDNKLTSEYCTKTLDANANRVAAFPVCPLSIEQPGPIA